MIQTAGWGLGSNPHRRQLGFKPLSGSYQLRTLHCRATQMCASFWGANNIYYVILFPFPFPTSQSHITSVILWHYICKNINIKVFIFSKVFFQKALFSKSEIQIFSKFPMRLHKHLVYVWKKKKNIVAIQSALFSQTDRQTDRQTNTQIKQKWKYNPSTKLCKKMKKKITNNWWKYVNHIRKGFYFPPLWYRNFGTNFAFSVWLWLPFS